MYLVNSSEEQMSSHFSQKYTMITWIKTLHYGYQWKALPKTNIDSVLNRGPESLIPRVMSLEHQVISSIKHIIYYNLQESTASLECNYHRDLSSIC